MSLLRGSGKIAKLTAKYRWRKKNAHNSTKMKCNFRIENVTVGKETYGNLEVIDYSNEKYKLNIGNYCSIAPNVVFVLGGEHNLDTVSTFPFKARMLEQGTFEAGSRGNIFIRDDVWIGVGATIMSGVEVGQGAVIGANALVTKDVPPYAVVGGVPAKIIRYRFSEAVIAKLVELDYSQLTKEIVSKNVDSVYEKIDENNIDEVLNSLKILRIRK